jgi:hypothetical protein
MSDTEDFYQETLERINEAVDRGPGWFLIAVSGDEETGTQPFAYTAGLSAEELPELIVSGHLPPDMSHAIVSQVIEKLRSNHLRYEDVGPEGMRLSQILAGEYDVVLRRVIGKKQHDFLTFALAYQRQEGRSASEMLSLQIVLPDRENRFPWDSDYGPGPSQDILWD